MSRQAYIKKLQRMINEREQFLQDEMTRSILGDTGIEVIMYCIEVYKQRIKDLQSCSELLPRYYTALSKAMDNKEYKHYVTFIVNKISWLEGSIYSPTMVDEIWIDRFLDMHY